MNTTLKVTVALASGIAIGALGIEALRAQSKPAALLVAEFDVTDPIGWKSYQEGVRAMPPNGGVFLARAAKGTGLAGAQPKTITIVQFPTVEDSLDAVRSRGIGRLWSLAARCWAQPRPLWLR